jgi:hypothetical protein
VLVVPDLGSVPVGCGGASLARLGVFVDGGDSCRVPVRDSVAGLGLYVGLALFGLW